MRLFVAEPENGAAVDPLLRAVLLQEVLETSCKGSKCLDIAMKQHRAHLEESSLNVFANWLDPESADVVAARNRAESVLRNLPDFNAASKQASELWTKLSSRVGNNYRWVGWLARNQQGDWECRAGRNLGSQPSGDLKVVLQDANGQVKTQKVGQMVQGKTLIDLNAPSVALLEGRPIFVVE
jgi:hypothetical protein